MMQLPFPNVAALTKDRTALPALTDYQGWHSEHPFFAQILNEVTPSLICEVGTWKGASALNMAQLTKGYTEPDEVSGAEVPNAPPVICIDTWLGGIDHLLSNLPQDDRRLDLNGDPKLYQLFLKNVAETSYANRIYPVRAPSTIGAKFLAHHNLKPDLIYIDGSHEYDDVYADLCAFVPLLSSRGVVFGDDFRGFPGVFAAVVRFAHENGFTIRVEDNNFWVLK